LKWARLEGGVTRHLEADQEQSLVAAQGSAAQAPPGIPSALLDRRPDIRAAEQQLVAANPRVGVAKAAFFPSIVLVAGGGAQTVGLLGVIQRTGTASQLNGVLDVPIFDAGRRLGGHKTARANREALVIALLSIRILSPSLPGT
jgi:outer membrane protein TolC